MNHPVVMIISALYAMGAIRIARLCANEAHYYPNWFEPNFLVPALASTFGWPILLLVVWARATRDFFSKGHV
jgi:hypothetical protein